MRFAADQSLVEVEIERPDDDVLDAIVDHGGKILHKMAEVWRGSDTCRHISHDRGTWFQVVAVPKSWIDEAAEDPHLDNFFDIASSSTPEFIVPADPPLLVVRHNWQRFAGRTQIVPLREFIIEMILSQDQ